MERCPRHRHVAWRHGGNRPSTTEQVAVGTSIGTTRVEIRCVHAPSRLRCIDRRLAKQQTLHPTAAPRLINSHPRSSRRTIRLPSRYAPNCLRPFPITHIHAHNRTNAKWNPEIRRAARIVRSRSRMKRGRENAQPRKCTSVQHSSRSIAAMARVIRSSCPAHSSPTSWKSWQQMIHGAWRTESYECPNPRPFATTGRRGPKPLCGDVIIPPRGRARSNASRDPTPCYSRFNTVSIMAMMTRTWIDYE